MQSMPSLSSLIAARTTDVRGAADRLFEVLYDELRAIASQQLQRLDYHGLLSATTLVHESYLRFLESGQLKPEDRGHFLAYASHVMRSVVVDFARSRLAIKRGGGQEHVTLITEEIEMLTASDEHVVRIHGALEELSAVEPRLTQIVEMRYFGGLTDDEVAEALAISPRTVQRGWDKARALLHVALKN